MTAAGRNDRFGPDAWISPGPLAKIIGEELRCHWVDDQRPTRGCGLRFRRGQGIPGVDKQGPSGFSTVDFF